jgi:hypothetical protein
MTKRQVALLACTGVIGTATYVFGTPLDYALDVLHGVRDAAGALISDPNLAPLMAMPVVQSTYTSNIPQAVAGMVADMNQYRVDSRNVETVAGIGFGVICGKGASDKGIVVGGPINLVEGVTVRDVTLAFGSTPDLYLRYALAGVLKFGDIWVTNSGPGAVVAGNDVTYSNVTGALGTEAVAGAIVGPLVGWRWMTSAASGALAIVRVPDFGQVGT